MSFLLAGRREASTHLLTMPVDREPRHPSCLADIDHCSTQSTSAHTPGAHQEAPGTVANLGQAPQPASQVRLANYWHGDLLTDLNLVRISDIARSGNIGIVVGRAIEAGADL